MQIITLNTWGGRGGKEQLLEFFRTHSDIDVFCLQETWAAPYENLEGMNAGGRPLKHSEIMVRGVSEISDALTNHNAFFHPQYESYGVMMLTKKEWQVMEVGDVFVHKERGFVPVGDIGFLARNIQYVTLKTPKGPRTIMNFHGLWNGQGKGDSEDRLKQSERIIEFAKSLKNPYVLCGDFNLLPETESLKKLETFGLRNLIAEYGITSTRTSLYTKPVKFADYVFVSDGITVHDFKILPDEVSDHAAMYLECE